MISGDICEHCRHYADHHGEDGVCNFRHPTLNNNAPCDCPGYEWGGGNKSRPTTLDVDAE